MSVSGSWWPADDEADTNPTSYHPIFQARRLKRSAVQYEDNPIKKSKTVSDLSALLLSCQNETIKHEVFYCDDHVHDTDSNLVREKSLDTLKFFCPPTLTTSKLYSIDDFILLSLNSPIEMTDTKAICLDKDFEDAEDTDKEDEEDDILVKNN
jgi:hypothetical protein